MYEPRSKARIALLSGLATMACLVGPILVILGIALAVEKVAEPLGENPQWLGIIIFPIWMIVSSLWGRTMARLAGTGRESRMQAIGALTFVPAIFLDVGLIIGLFKLFPAWHRSIDLLPTYKQYPWFFVPSAFIVAAMSAFLLSVVAANWRVALRNALVTGLVSAAVFWLVVIIMDAIGYRVGAIRPGLQPALPPMPFVTLTGTAFGSLVGGGLLGVLLSLNHEPQEEMEVYIAQTAEA